MLFRRFVTYFLCHYLAAKNSRLLSGDVAEARRAQSRFKLVTQRSPQLLLGECLCVKTEVASRGLSGHTHYYDPLIFG